MPIKPKAKPRKGSSGDAKETLLNMRKKLLAERSEGPKAGALVVGVETGDEMDLASDLRDREISMLLTQRGRKKLLAIDEALDKIKKGGYGICEECGEKIGAGRLRVMPLAKHCVECQGKIEEEIESEEDLKYEGFSGISDMEDEER
jgi:DnaK suppressor protein